MTWFTKADVARAADVFLSWFGRISAATQNTYDDSITAILTGQKDNFVNIIASMLNLQAEDSGLKAPSPCTFAELEAVLPGIKPEDVAALNDAQCRSLIAVAKCCKKRD